MYFKLNDKGKWHKLRTGPFEFGRDGSLCGIWLYETDVFVIKSETQPVSNFSPSYCQRCKQLNNKGKS